MNITSLLDQSARDLHRQADADGLPMAGRRFIVEGVLGSLYGATLQAGEDDTRVSLRLEVTVPAVTKVYYDER